MILPWKLITLRETDLNGWCTGESFVSDREHDFERERENQPIGACLSLSLSIFFFFFSSKIPLSYLLSHYFFFLILVFYFLVLKFLIPWYLSLPLVHDKGLPLWCLPWSNFTILALNNLCLVWVYLPTTTGLSVCHSPSPDKGKLFCLFVCCGTLSCYGLGAFSLPIPHGMNLVVPT